MLVVIEGAGIGGFFGTAIVVAEFMQDGITVWARERSKIRIIEGRAGGCTLRALCQVLHQSFLGFTARSTRMISCSYKVNGGVQEPGGVGGWGVCYREVLLRGSVVSKEADELLC